MKPFLVLISFCLSYSFLCSQNFSAQEKADGYSYSKEVATFIFDPEVYQVEPKRVVVTGAFRNWDQSLSDPQWRLKKNGSIWTLEVNNNDMTIPVNSPFKYRIDDGLWLDPPDNANNKKGADLVFLPQEGIIKFKAELRHEYLIWAQINPAERSLKVADYQLTDAKGSTIPIARILPHEAHSLLVIPQNTINKKRVYFLTHIPTGQKVHCSFDGWFRSLYSHKELGANITTLGTDVRLFAPRADSVVLYLYKERANTAADEIIPMQQDDQGVWEYEDPRDLHGYYYDFTIHGSADPGNYFYNRQAVHITDPYSRVSDDTWGRSRIWKTGQPATPLSNGIPPMEDIVAYEVHVQDFTDNLPLPENLKGTLKGMITPGLRNSSGAKVGFDYLVDLGINVLHLMPVQEYLHYPTDDWQASFSKDPYMIDQGVAHENYQWGYRTSHFMAVESRYRTKGSEPGTERQELKELVQAFHDKGIAVIIDIVPNHTAENMDGNSWYFNFNAIDQQYYYRTKDFQHIGAYGNEIKTENRPMVQRWLIDQCQHFINEFGIDGFRIDLAGQIDEQSLKALKEAIGHDKILYGEAWIGSNDPDYEDNPDWDWYKNDAPITFFQDDTRNAYKGPVFELNDPQKDRGWPGGNYEDREKVMNGLINKNPDDKTPLSGISYLDIHDNFALADQFGVDFDGRNRVLSTEYKIAAVLLYTTLGPIVTHGGSEIMRSKAHAPLKEVIKTTLNGYKTYMHGYRDTYNHRKANQFIWEQVGQIPNGENYNDYDNMLEFWRGLNEFRLSQYGEVFRVAENVEDNYYHWLLPKQKSALGYIVNQKILVLINAGDHPVTFSKVELPNGKWKLIGNTNKIDIQGVRSKKGHKISGGKKCDITLNSKELLIWAKK